MLNSAPEEASKMLASASWPSAGQQVIADSCARFPSESRSIRWASLTCRATRELAVAAYVGLLLVVGTTAPALGNGGPSGSIVFDIPTQPLADALEAYGAATGLDVYYNGALSIGRRSTAVKGKMSARNAIALLLQGTGYVSRTTGTSAISIIPELPEPPPPAVLSLQDMHQYDPFLAAVQARLSQALCATESVRADRHQIVFKFWISALGMITHVEIAAGGEDAARNLALVSDLEGMTIGEPPPADMPEPLIMAVYPAAGDAAGCGSP